MSLKLNGTAIDSVKYNGMVLTKVSYNGTTVWETSYSSPLCFTANTAGSTVTLTKSGSPSWTGYYSTDGTTWFTYTLGAEITLRNISSKVYFKGTYTAANTIFDYLKFTMTGSIAASGNIMSFCSGDNYADVTTIPYNYMFYILFSGCTSLTSAPLLPATTLTNYCYAGMFTNCTALTTAPSLPATTLASACYNLMFQGCTALTTASALSATTLADNCCSYMFKGCTSLITAPTLSATGLSAYCYQGMFQGCTSLVTPPSLRATSIATGCYRYMFKGCTSLTSLPALANQNAMYAFTEMFSGCTSLYVSDSPITGVAEQMWRIPWSAPFTNTYVQAGMFTDCLGTRASDDMAGEQGQYYTYYTQNVPV